MIAFVPLPAVMLTILADGGLVAHLQKHGGFALPGTEACREEGSASTGCGCAPGSDWR